MGAKGAISTRSLGKNSTLLGGAARLVSQDLFSEPILSPERSPLISRLGQEEERERLSASLPTFLHFSSTL